MVSMGLAKHLEKRFGLGSFPAVSKRLYARLERELDRYGEPVHLIISEVAEASICATRDRGAWFRAGVQRRLTDAGYLRKGNKITGQEAAAKLTAALAAECDGRMEVHHDRYTA